MSLKKNETEKDGEGITDSMHLSGPWRVYKNWICWDKGGVAGRVRWIESIPGKGKNLNKYGGKIAQKRHMEQQVQIIWTVACMKANGKS